MGASQLLVSSAEQRVDRVLFSGRAEADEHKVHVGTYTCPHCRAETEFNTGTLRKAEGFSGSPLGTVWHERCERARGLGPWQWALDFRCPGCSCPVRIVFQADVEFAMGAHTHRLVHVIEETACLTSTPSQAV
jgi:hypothetical protein